MTARLTKEREKQIRGYAQYDGPSEHIWMIQDLLAEIDALRDERAQHECNPKWLMPTVDELVDEAWDKNR